MNTFTFRQENQMNSQNLTSTTILDYQHPLIAQVVASIRASSDREFLRQAHRYIMDAVHPIYNIDELQPASLTLEKGIGSCTQRTACVEAMARAFAIPTRTRILWIAGKFWYPRFPRWTYPFIPERIMLLWPEFYVDELWLDFSEIIAPLEVLASYANSGFTNEAETIFDAVAVRPVDFTNRLGECGCGHTYDLSSYVLDDGGIFASRDDALHHYGSFQHTLRGVAFQLLYAGKTTSVTDPSLIQSYT
jgi:hypothetical protein